MIINKVESFVFKDYKAKAFVGKLNLFDNKSKIFPHEETQNENNINYSILKNHPIILGTKISARNESIELEGNLIILDGHHRFEYILKNEVDEVFDVIFVDYEDIEVSSHKSIINSSIEELNNFVSINYAVNKNKTSNFFYEINGENFYLNEIKSFSELYNLKKALQEKNLITPLGNNLNKQNCISFTPIPKKVIFSKTLFPYKSTWITPRFN